ncbi:MAG: DUF1236 domain-containing protein [Alphaproteobacteria bacterium]|nr:DUF1236 domain-containing protein [Alphaproteobacteria bacterium]
MRAKASLVAAAAVFGLGSAAMAMPAVVTADLALRAGPGPAHPIIATIDRNGIVELEGCIDAGMWCKVSWNGVTGWTYAAYLGQQTRERIVVIPEARRTIQVPTVVYQEQRAATVSQTAPATVQTYITTNKIEPIFVEGEPVVGATLPSSVVVREVPQYQYRYAVVNGRTVLVEPGTNRIVYVYR